jgi:hypothetical protein
MGGRTLTIIDTFAVESVEAAGEAHTVRVRFPRSVQVQSVTWTTSAAPTDDERRLRIRGDKITEAPHVVGWPAFQRHLREVAPAAADTVLQRAAAKLKPPRAGAGV